MSLPSRLHVPFGCFTSLFTRIQTPSWAWCCCLGLLLGWGALTTCLGLAIIVSKILKGESFIYPVCIWEISTLVTILLQIYCRNKSANLSCSCCCECHIHMCKTWLELSVVKNKYTLCEDDLYWQLCYNLMYSMMTGSFTNQPPVQHIGLTLTCLFIWFESIELLTRVILLCLNLFIVDIYILASIWICM